MQVALATWKGRISPLFDATRALLVATVENGKILSRRIERLDNASPYSRAARLRELDADLLICGGISSQFADPIEDLGIRIISFAAGSIDDILDAFLDGRLAQKHFRMPGCGAEADRS